MSGGGGTACASALYQFDAENENELSFQAGDVITLLSQLDENWYEGELNGATGIFPTSYVEIMTPLT